MLDDGDSGIFPEDIISEILTRLPAKTIHRFKCVSKKWNSIICNPNFIISYISKSSLKWVIFDQSIWVDPDSETQFKLQLEQPPNVSTLSLNPTKLGDDCKKKFIKDHKYPAPMITLSNGFILFSIKIKRDPLFIGKTVITFSWVTEEDSLYVVNPITRDWVQIPQPEFILKLGSVGFITEVGPTGVLERFMIVEYQPIVGSKSANLMCFSSETWKWDEIEANYMLGMHIWNGDGVLEFDGNLIWVDWTIGIIIWDKPFDWNKKGKEKVRLRFIALPRAAPLSEARRCVDIVSGHIQYLEVYKGGNQELSLWRLKDYKGGEWSLVHKVCLQDVRSDDIYLGYGSDKVIPQIQKMHPYQADIVVLMVENRVCCLDFRTQKVESCGSIHHFLNEFTFIGSFKLPSWPTSFSPSLKATFLKEQGNKFFKAKNFNEAIHYYSRSITLSPSALAYANRAVAYLNTHRYHEAEVDCTEALKLNGDYLKAYWRRAIARKELGDLKGYVEDVEFAWKLEPDNKEMKKLYAQVKSLIEKRISSGPVSTAPPALNDAFVMQDNGSESGFGHGSTA